MSTDTRATPIQSLQNNGELVDNVQNTYQDMSSEEEPINENIYDHQMDNDVNESFSPQEMSPSQNVNPPTTMTSKLMQGLKAPVIVLVLFVILNLQIVKKMIIGLLSKVISPENAMIETGSVFIRALVCSLLFYIVNRVV